MEWLESTALAEWVRTSLVGYPLVLTVHSIGMAIMVGLMTVVNLRLVGQFERIPLTALDNMIRIAWYGLAVNVITGASIFTSQAVAYTSSTVFITKMVMVVGGSVAAAYLQPILRREAAGWAGGGTVPQGVKTLAALSIGMWSVAIIMGRFTAYL
jgi:hypothetical protein